MNAVPLERLPVLLAADERVAKATRGALFAKDGLGVAGQHVRRAAFGGMPRDHLSVFLSNAAGQARRAWAKEGSWIGRLANRLSVARPGYVEVPGAVLSQILRALGAEDGALDRDGRYYLRLDIAEGFAKALGSAKEAVS
ncbi:MAG: hypothetical protein AAFW87_00505 [Pseudomonadota bacterium]